MQETVSAVLMLVGALFMLIGALGVLRLPDLYMRVSAATKASTVGVGFSLLALAVHFGEFGIASRALATIGFIVISAPVAAHLISMSAYRSGVGLWKESLVDELKDQPHSAPEPLDSPRPVGTPKETATCSPLLPDDDSKN